MIGLRGTTKSKIVTPSVAFARVAPYGLKLAVKAGVLRTPVFALFTVRGTIEFPPDAQQLHLPADRRRGDRHLLHDVRQRRRVPGYPARRGDADGPGRRPRVDHRQRRQAYRNDDDRRDVHLPQGAGNQRRRSHGPLRRRPGQRNGGNRRQGLQRTGQHIQRAAELPTSHLLRRGAAVHDAAGPGQHEPDLQLRPQPRPHAGRQPAHRDLLRRRGR